MPATGTTLLVPVAYNNANGRTAFLEVQVFWDVTLCHSDRTALSFALKTHTIQTFETASYVPSDMV
jgi:hypothetical protein